MWRFGNAQRRCAAAAGALALAIGLLCAGAAGAQDLPDQAPPVETSDGEVAYHLVQGWVRAGAVPADDDLLSAPLTGVFGVYVTLRDDGRLMGRGVAYRPDLVDTIDIEGPPVDMARLLAQAAREAMQGLQTRHQEDAAEHGIRDPELIDQTLTDLLERIKVDVQIGYGLESIVLPAAGEPDAVLAQFVPGYHGLRLSGPLMPTGDLVWPGNALARNSSPRSQLVQLLTRQGYEPDDLALIARPAGPQLQRFRVIHYVQAGPGQPPRALVRGNIDIPPRALDGRAIAGIAERIARHLDGKYEVLNDGVMVMRGPFHPSASRIDPQLATVEQGALACFAVMAQAATTQAQRPGDRLSRTRAERTLKVIDTLAPAVLPEVGPPNAIGTALLLLALSESPVQVDAELRDDLGNALMAMRQPNGRYLVRPEGFRRGPEDDGIAGRATEAVITAALAAWYTQTDRPRADVREAVWQSMNELVQANQDDEQGTRLADLTWLSIAYHRAGTEIANATDDAQAREKLAAIQAFFADQVQLLIDQQVQGKPLFGPDDISGGYVTRQGPPGSAPDPSWESAMPLSVVAAALRDPDIVPADQVFGPMLSAQLGARFTAQLLITDNNAYYVRDTLAASGGVRRSLWDNTLDLDCSAMSLVALSELQRSLHTLEQRDAPE